MVSALDAKCYAPVSPALSGSAADRAEAIAQRCGGGRERHGRWQVCCPAHEDSDPSLSVTCAGDKVLLHCFARCTTAAICAAIGITLPDLFADDLPPRYPPVRKPSRPTLAPAPQENDGEALALEMALHFVLSDVSYLEMPGIQATLRTAATQPLLWLWLEQQLFQHGLSPRVVWQVLYPHAEEVFPEPPPRATPAIARPTGVLRPRRPHAPHTTLTRPQPKKEVTHGA